MPKVDVNEFVSLDGVVQAPSGPPRIAPAASRTTGGTGMAGGVEAG